MDYNLIIDKDLESAKTSVLNIFKQTNHLYENINLFFKTKDDIKYLSNTKDHYRHILFQQHKVTEKILWKITKQGMMSFDLRVNLAYVVIMESLVNIARYARKLAKYLHKYVVESEFIISIKLILKLLLEMFDVCYKLIASNSLELIKELTKIHHNLDTVFEEKASDLIRYLKKELNTFKTKRTLKTYEQIKGLGKASNNLTRIGAWVFYSKKAYFSDLKDLEDN